VGLCLFSFASVGRFEFVNWDDAEYVSGNARVLQGLNAGTVKWALTARVGGNWHPVTMLSHALDTELFGSAPGPRHVVNLVLHISSTLLLFTLLMTLTGAVGRTAFVAAIFAVHPLHVESVAWIAERKDVLSGFFMLLTLLAYVGYVRRPAWHRSLIVCAVFVLALMSKPMAVTLPLLMLLLDVWPLGRLSFEAGRGKAWRRLIAEKMPLVGLAVATGVLTVLIQASAGALPNLATLPWHSRLANAAVAYVAYVAKALWPARLAAFYPQQAWSAGIVLTAVSILVVVTVLVSRARRTHPYLFVGWLWFVVALAPVIGIIQAGEQAMADRYTYVPLIGLLIAVAWGAARLRLHRTALALGAAVAVVSCAVTTRAQVRVWSDSESLWRHALSVTTSNYRAHEKLAEVYRDRGQLADAYDEYTTALSLAPPNSPQYAAIIHNDLGLVRMRQGRMADAIDEFSAAVAANSQSPDAQTNLGNAMAAVGRFDEAKEHYRLAMQAAPDAIEARLGSAGVSLRSGHVSDATREYAEAVRIKPDMAEAHNGYGAALAAAGQDDRAISEYEEALRLNASLASAHANLGILLLKRGEMEGARRHLETAVRIDPGLRNAQQALSRLPKLPGP
jgi:protein O-mannosyl-transferase